MRNYNRYGRQTITTANFTAKCAVYDNRVGFVHECTLIFDGSEYYAKSQYYNRTWESYEFESVIYKAIQKLPAFLRDQAKTEFEAWANHESEKMEAKFKAFQDAFASLTESQKKSLSSVTVENKADFDSVCMATQAMALLNK